MNTIFKTVRPKKSAISFLGIIFIISIIISACEEDPSSLGSDLLPESKEYRVDSSLSFSGCLFETGVISTSNLNNYNLGIIDDEYFGFFKSEFAGQFVPSHFFTKNDSIIANYNVDSLILYLAIDSIYGLSNDLVTFNIYELSSEIEDSLNHRYYSDEDINEFYAIEDIINTNCIISGDTIIKLTLSEEFTDKLIPNEITDTIYKNAINFLTNFKGLAIIPSLINSSGTLYNINLSSDDSKIVMYYNDTLTFNYKLLGYRFAEYTYDYSGSIANNYLENLENENDSLLFLQGINGILSKIKFNNINQLIQADSNYSILRAELTVPVFEDPNFQLFPPPKNLYFYYSNDNDSTLVQVEDYSYSSAFGGSYDSTKKVYQFDISKHLMSLLNSNVSDSCLNFNIINKYSYPQRTILETNNIKLKFTYTKH